MFSLLSSLLFGFCLNFASIVSAACNCDGYSYISSYNKIELSGVSHVTLSNTNSDIESIDNHNGLNVITTKDESVSESNDVNSANKIGFLLKDGSKLQSNSSNNENTVKQDDNTQDIDNPDGIVLNDYKSVFAKDNNVYNNIYKFYAKNSTRSFNAYGNFIAIADGLYLRNSSTFDSSTFLSKARVVKDVAVDLDKRLSSVFSGPLELNSIVFFDSNRWSVVINGIFINSTSAHSISEDLYEFVPVHVFKDRALFIFKLKKEALNTIIKTHLTHKLFDMQGSLYSNKNHSIIVDREKSVIAVMLYNNQSFLPSDMEIVRMHGSYGRFKYINSINNNTNNKESDSKTEKDTPDNNTNLLDKSNAENNKPLEDDIGSISKLLQNAFKNSEILNLYKIIKNTSNIK
ncbi:exported hypothetical protein [Candidatus Xenohaliotis californiensis]|uniref:Uncharacterized protein n=1 Tax=Candidatus Xenohaliotis californiensis TaxID=84677 RepID=A0ABP0ETP1_9RICK|nr:exported hypothetical protein [Candidatus Xenohaliotis californiensis]